MADGLPISPGWHASRLLMLAAARDVAVYGRGAREVAEEFGVSESHVRRRVSMWLGGDERGRE